MENFEVVEMAERCWTRIVKLGERLTVEITVSSSGKMVCEWSPDLPDRRLSDRQLKRYQAARDGVVAEMEKETGLWVLILE